MTYYLILIIVKIFDNVIGTFKSIFTYKGYKVLSSLLVIVSQLIFYLLINQIVEDNTLLTIVIVSVSSGIGNYIAFCINDKVKRPDKWSMIITSSRVNEIKGLCGFLKEHDIKYIAYHSFNRQWEDNISVLVFSKTKDESRLIDQYLEENNTKYLLEKI